MGTSDFSNSDISAWTFEGNVSLTHDAQGYLIANVSAFTGEFYQDNITLRNLVTQEGNTYTISFTARTDIEGGRDVQFFLEDTDAGFLKYFLETETLTNDFQTFTYTYISTSGNYDTTLGIFLGNMENGKLGNVIIDEIIITKTEGLQGTKLEDLDNPLFDSNDISAWTYEGNITLSYDEEGYLVAEVSDFTGNFWEDNITYRDLIVEAWTTYTITIILKSSVERDVVLFAEDTDAGFAKYVESTFAVGTDWTTIEVTFRPTEDNADTTIGLFLGLMDGATFGEIMIDSIVITAVKTFN